MKTPLRGEMLRGADFIIAVVSARAGDPFQTMSRRGAGPTDDSVRESPDTDGTLAETGGDKHSGKERHSGCFNSCRAGLERLPAHTRSHLFRARSEKGKC